MCFQECRVIRQCLADGSQHVFLGPCCESSVPLRPMSSIIGFCNKLCYLVTLFLTISLILKRLFLIVVINSLLKSKFSFYSWNGHYSDWSMTEFLFVQPCIDLQHVMEGLHEYTGILSTFPEIMHVHKVRCCLILALNITILPCWLDKLFFVLFSQRWRR